MKFACLSLSICREISFFARLAFHRSYASHKKIIPGQIFLKNLNPISNDE